MMTSLSLTSSQPTVVASTPSSFYPLSDLCTTGDPSPSLLLFWSRPDDMPPFFGVLGSNIPYVPFPRNTFTMLHDVPVPLHLSTSPYAFLYPPTYPYISLCLTIPFPILSYSSRCFAILPTYFYPLYLSLPPPPPPRPPYIPPYTTPFMTPPYISS
ncbi:hypothetical protein BJ322DRAFT_137593 [Thelephora terrestris]|uniref:Uncharacterized protein n=1 Tax=Thelephora terrestris TaxID=56493 RepID=A0A9P6HBF0_9AGAM|nr:hypothetical protein BJ322DRAFT_137593 [Thelephora terrestris]